MKKKRDQGASLLEAMISIVLLAMGSLALIRLELGAMQQAQLTRQNELELRQALSQQEAQRASLEAARSRQIGGFTLVELLVALVISSGVILAALALYVNGVQQREYQAASNLLQENERYLFEVLTRSVHQTGFENWQEGGILRPPSGATVQGVNDAVTDLVAFNNSGLDTEPPWDVFDGATSAALQHQNNAKNRYLNNDVLMLRFQSMNDPKGAADSGMGNCVGQNDPPTTAASAWRYRPWVAFGVVGGSNTGGEPELSCRYLNVVGGSEGSDSPVVANWVVRPLARGVEVFQLMLAVAPGPGSAGLRWLTPLQVAQQGLWPTLLAVRFGLVLRSPNRVFTGGLGGTAKAQATPSLTPLGSDYTRTDSEDPGAHFTPPDDGRLRRVLAFTVSLRNPLATEPG